MLTGLATSYARQTLRCLLGRDFFLLFSHRLSMPPSRAGPSVYLNRQVSRPWRTRKGQRSAASNYSGLLGLTGKQLIRITFILSCGTSVGPRTF
ncbi:hypothetical protein ASPSYDRAFT_559745 [Aspergillus sydowii CBS 593.65]|uniref:Uncharacterized protein n=1 Tax=Aspergillus sydowii CBS 593.65 TaxID=1036612 RepID=A0A1L9T084_9EURO|nr:uncharacterized protein ASPSYDRAFT_559745 [Aspergillus sydowii CBS 593.65]OJJ52741.1 hypothetical protein ASPSYDRAFT_559745 [Aspergillus sydowii CBS 593.65]